MIFWGRMYYFSVLLFCILNGKIIIAQSSFLTSGMLPQKIMARKAPAASCLKGYSYVKSEKPSPEIEKLFHILTQRRRRAQRLEDSSVTISTDSNDTTTTEDESLDQSLDSTESKVFQGGDSLFPSLQSKYDTLYQQYQKQKANLEETERAFQNLFKIHESKAREFQTAVETNRQMFDIAEQIKNQYSELREITEDNENKLNYANDRMALLEQMLSEEKRSGEKLRKEMKLLKQPVVADHSACNVVFEEEQKHKEFALKQMKEMCDELREVKKENALIKEDNRELKDKVAEIVTIKNELSMQNANFLHQFDKMQEILSQKDRHIAELLVPRNPFDDIAVKHKIENLEKAHENEKEMWQRKQNYLMKQIETFHTKKIELQQMVDQSQNEMEATCKKHQLLKRSIEVEAGKFQKEIGIKENQVLGLVEAAKNMKKNFSDLQIKNENLEMELTVLREHNRVKDIEISVLGDAKQILEEQIKKYVFERDTVYQIAKQFEEQIESIREKLKQLENCKYDLHQQLKEAHCKVQTERESYKIQEKILEDSRDTVAMLKCKLRECCRKLNKCARERDMLIRERDC